MSGNHPSQEYIPRVEEDSIRRVLKMVHDDRQSRAVLLTGSGGVGKTSLVRRMSESSSDEEIVWLEPVDVDDPECWLLSNLERRVADRLDPDDIYFRDYQQQLSQLSNYTSMDISHETIVSYLGRVKEVFVDCYKRYIDTAGKTVVIAFDTVETIRGTNLLLTLAQWMRTLPAGTLFILSGRPISDRHQDQPDPIIAELENPYQHIEVIPVKVSGFTYAGARRYIEASKISEGLVGQEKDKLVLLTRGHPLWLGFMIDYLLTEGMPEEVEQTSIDYMEQHLPYGAPMSAAGEELHRAFLQRLVAPYRGPDFWHEAIRRLAVVRQPIARVVWERLMADLALPDDVADIDVAWSQLMTMAWIRPRGNSRAVTLHDAVAEEFAQVLFPLHDQDQQWRHMIWRRALEIYTDLATKVEASLGSRLSVLDEDLKRADAARSGVSGSVHLEGALIERSARLDDRKRELDQLRAARIYYLFLHDFKKGCQELLQYFAQAEQQHDTFFQDLMVLYLQRFLPDGTYSSAFNDVIKVKLEEFRSWLSEKEPRYYVALGIMGARYLIEAAEPEAALRLLGRLPEEAADLVQLHRLRILQGNACLRIPDRVQEGEWYFGRAIGVAGEMESADRRKLMAEAYKEQGYFFRNTGQWVKADLSYKLARDTMSRTLSAQSPSADRNEIASIQTNWAYVKGLNGSYGEGIELAQSAIGIRRKMNHFADEGMSYSVLGEVYRYARRFEQAWAAYSAAVRLLRGRRYSARLGFVYQEQAICLYQALQDNIRLTADPISDAKELIKNALSICLSQAIRGYPSALNRAGRIFGHDNPAEGLAYLKEGISEARRLNDGWFWYANLVEHTELSYRIWVSGKQDGASVDQYRLDIESLGAEIERLSKIYEFPDLIGRWYLLQGHLAIHDYLDEGGNDKIDGALLSYQTGFIEIAQKHVGSSGAASLPGEFQTFRRLFFELPSSIQADWLAKLRSAWELVNDGSTLLLARLEELY